MEAGRLHVEQQPYEPQRVLLEVVELMAPLAAERGLDIVHRSGVAAGVRVLGDASRVKQVLHNLLGNALKFTPQGRITVELAPEADGRLRFTVNDSGIGIAPARLQSIFEPFEQAAEDAETRRQGLGLGRFMFTLAAPPAPGAAAEPAADAAPPQLRGHVLVVDDNDVNALVAQAMLQRLGLSAATAADGQLALAAMAGQRFDAVLMDCRMPTLDGFAATRRWREGERGRRLPIIGVTANVSAEDRRQCLDAGMDGFLGKPYRLGDLAAVLQRHLAPA
jgi:two-component system, sensor histidine kinase